MSNERRVLDDSKYDDVDDLPESIEQALARTDQDDGIILISEELPVLTS